MKIFSIPKKTKVDLHYTEKEDADKIFLSITDEADGRMLCEIYTATEQRYPAYWFRVSKERFFSALVSLWPDEVAVVTDVSED